MKISFVATVLNEEKTIEKLLGSLLWQTKKPDEIIIVDGGSKDRTIKKIIQYTTPEVSPRRRRGPSTSGVKVRYYILPGANRAKGRNVGIKKAIGEIIAISDAGCELDKDWLKNITKAFDDPEVEVVAGYYQAKAKSIFEKCVVPYVLVMPDRVNPQDFLPASRSMAIKKSVWQKFAGFPEEFSDNEDYVFSKRLKKGGAKIVFCGEAIVYWSPCSNLKDFFLMIYRFARGDAQAGLRYKKVASIFLRYLVAVFVLFWFSIFGGIFLLIVYIAWAVWKNYRYVKHPLAFFYLPILQVTADLAVMVGTVEGLLNSIIVD